MITAEEIKRVCEASLEIERCMNDMDFLCNKLSGLDSGFLKSFYNSENTGAINDLRKKVCEILLLSDIDSDKLQSLFDSAKNNNPSDFKSLVNSYSILNNLINSDYKDVDLIMNNFKNKILKNIGDVNCDVSDFSGVKNVGASNYCLSFYNGAGVKIFIDFSGSKIKFGVRKESNKKSECELVRNQEEFSVEEFESFLEREKHSILDDVSEINESDGNTFVKAAMIILSENSNHPMTANEIWEEISSRKLYSSSGKTPAATLNAIMSRNSINANVKHKSESNIFKRIDDKPVKFILVSYLPKQIEKALIQNGFVTNDKLEKRLEELEGKLTKIYDYLGKNNIKINI